MTMHAKREITLLLTCGLLLAACSYTSSTQKAPNDQRRLEAAACKLINVPPKPDPAGFEAISMPISTLIALEKTGERSLEDMVRSYDAAASEQNTVAMIRALASGVKECHRLGLQTAP